MDRIGQLHDGSKRLVQIGLRSDCDPSSRALRRLHKNNTLTTISYETKDTRLASDYVEGM
jgi:hypothetical protein